MMDVVSILSNKIKKFDDKYNHLAIKERLSRDADQIKASSLSREIHGCSTDKSEFTLISKIKAWIMNRIMAELQAHQDNLDIELILPDLDKAIYQKVFDCTYRTLILEYNIYTDSEKETDFNFACEQESYLEYFFCKYPGLSIILINLKKKLISFIAYILHCYRQDKQALVTTSMIGKGKITKIKLSEGDSHQDGKSVTIINVGNKKVVFKPTVADMNILYNDIMNIYNAQSEIKIRLLKLHPGQNYHWCQYISKKECNTVSELRYFYTSIGIQLAIIYAFNGTDFHCENLIAEGKNPVLIDFECLFTLKAALPPEFASSVLKTRIIPALTKKKTAKYLSALGKVDCEGNGSKRIITYQGKYIWLKKIKSNLSEKKNIPYLNHGRVCCTNYIREVIEGFNCGYDFVLNNRDFILQRVKNKYQSSRHRMLINPTSYYMELLSTSYHPQLLSSEESRKMFLVTLFADHEINDVEETHFHQLVNGDVPLYYIGLNETDCLTDRSAIDCFADKLISLDEKDRLFQIKLIQLSLNSLKDKSNDVGSYCRTGKLLPVHEGIKKVEKIFSLIVSHHHNHHHYSFSEDDGISVLTQCKEGLYNGFGGIAFLAITLYMATNKNQYLHLAIEWVTAKIDDQLDESGAFIGRASCVYLLDLLYRLTGERRFYELAVVTMEQVLAHKIEHETESCDFLSGHAGCLSLCCHLIEHHQQDTRPQKLASKFYQLIADKAKNNQDGTLCWGDSLTGFSHGVSGIVSSLAKYQCFYHDVDPDLFSRALDYEFHLRRIDGWPDLRTASVHSQDIGYWCNGSSGIALARKDLLDRGIQYHSLQDDLTLALKKSCSPNSKTGKLSLCHSFIGNALIDYWIHSSSQDDAAHSKDTIMQAFELINLDEIEQQAKNFSLDISLMTGIAGIAYAYLYVNHKNLPFIMNLSAF